MPKGMMLAAGRGTRLGPLTENQPKPLLPVANRPVMEQGIACLRRLGIREIGVNISYLGKQVIAAFGDGSAHGVNLHWLQEPEPTGTAGGLKGMQSLLQDDLIVVIAGDAMLDIDLEPLLAAHQKKGAFITLATIPVQDPSQYGMVVTNDSGRVLHFQEKPAPGTEISHQANTGIYILYPSIFHIIPPNTFYDFALNVFPEVLRRSLPFYAMPVEGYWTDIGNPGDYLQANLDYLAGQIRIEGQGTLVDSSLLAHDCAVTGAILSRCIIGEGACLPRGCTLTDCVVWPGTILPEAVTLASTILTPYGAYRIDGKTACPIMVGV